jgi:hypothetical protein
MPRQIDLSFRPDDFAAPLPPRSACRMVNTILRMRERQTMAHVCRRVLWLDGPQTNPTTPLTHQTGSGWTRWSSGCRKPRGLDLVWSSLHAHQRKLSAALAVRANFELRSTQTRFLPGSGRQHATPYAVCSKSEMFHFYVKLPRSLLMQSSPAPPSR